MLLSVSITVLMMACGKEETSPPDERQIPVLLKQVKQRHVPDSRVDRLDVAYSQRGDQIVLTGISTVPDGRADLLVALTNAGFDYVDSIQSLPAAELAAQPFALTRHSVVNLRSKRGHSQELATQLLLGTPVQLLLQEEEWFLVRCPDNYIAWLHSGELVRKTTAEMAQWRQSPRVVYTPQLGISTRRQEGQVTQVSDLVAGCVFRKGAIIDDQQIVYYPDGRSAQLPLADVQNFVDWLTENPLSFERTVDIGRQQLGKPYFWGGTSPKAMDCSGFTKTVYWQQGLIIPRDASQQVHAGEAVIYDDELNGLQAGDFLFFGRYREDGTQKITHVGIYLDEGAFIHSGSDNGANRVENLLPNHPDFAAHRRESLLQARRLAVGSHLVRKVREHEWYF